LAHREAILLQRQNKVQNHPTEFSRATRGDSTEPRATKDRHNYPIPVGQDLTHLIFMSNRVQMAGLNHRRPDFNLPKKNPEKTLSHNRENHVRDATRDFQCIKSLETCRMSWCTTVPSWAYNDHHVPSWTRLLFLFLMQMKEVHCKEEEEQGPSLIGSLQGEIYSRHVRRRRYSPIRRHAI
jgi:hypothetical protein